MPRNGFPTHGVLAGCQRPVVSAISVPRADSTREIEDQTRHQNDADYAAAEHGAAKAKHPGNE